MTIPPSAGQPLTPGGTVTFLGVPLQTAPDVLVPRLETELLASAAIAALAAMPGDTLRVVDMCCGAGNVACAVAVHVPRARVDACDLTEPCVALAARNVALTGLSDRVTIHRGDLFEPLTPLGLAGTIDVVTCNPPYISTTRLETHSAHLLEHEPREAFDGGPYGLSIHQRVIREAQTFLRPGALLLFEIGAGQDAQVRRLLERSGAFDRVTAHTDDAGVVRVLAASRIPTITQDHTLPHAING